MEKREVNTMKAFVLLADGFEEIEALAPIDVLRRAGVDVLTLSINDNKNVVGTHNVSVVADDFLANHIDEKADIIITPGGLPGAFYLRDSKLVQEILKKQFDDKGLIASICASPIALDSAGVLDAKYTCYPGVEKQIKSGNYLNERVVFDKNIITGKGPGAAIEFALKIVEVLLGKEKADSLKEEMIVL